MFKLSIFFYFASELSICNQNLAYFQLLVRHLEIMQCCSESVKFIPSCSRTEKGDIHKS